MAEHAALIAVDWGTSALRAYLVACGGEILARTETADGILAAATKGFEAVLAGTLAPWLGGAANPPIVMSGMIGSRQGWAEAPYLACPADAVALGRSLHRIGTASLGSLWIVPGLLLNGTLGDIPDVMRGEETQVIGALSAGRRAGTFVLPGTHSKWVEVEDGRIVRFATYMTGEVFAALSSHTILGRLMTGSAIDAEGFARGVADAAAVQGPAGALLHRIFAARTLALTDRLPPQQVAGYLSGLLIGAEIAAARPGDGHAVIIANAALTRLYGEAAARLGVATAAAASDCVVDGLLAVARAAGLLDEDRVSNARPG